MLRLIFRYPLDYLRIVRDAREFVEFYESTPLSPRDRREGAVLDLMMRHKRLKEVDAYLFVHYALFK